MSDGRRDAMAISSLLSSTPPSEEPVKTVSDKLDKSGLGVPLPQDAKAAEAVNMLVNRFKLLQKTGNAYSAKQADHLDAMSDALRDNADLFVADAHAKLYEEAVVRAKSRPQTQRKVSSAASESEEKQKSKRIKKSSDSEGGSFVPIAPAGGVVPIKSKAEDEQKGKRKRKDATPAGVDPQNFYTGSQKKQGTPTPSENNATSRGGGDGSSGNTSVSKRSKKTDDDEGASSAGATKAALQRRERQYKSTFEGIWRDIARKEIPKAHKLYVVGSTVKLSNCRKTATLAAKEARKWQVRTNRNVKDMQTKARRAMREMMSYWKRSEKEVRDSKKKAEKEALDSARKEEEERENMRQSRKLNFLITQTELYSHFVGSKKKDGEADGGSEQPGDAKTGALDFDNADDEQIRAAAAASAQSAVDRARSKASQFDEPTDGDDGFQNPESLGDKTVSQPKLLSCQLKEYQLKGLTWLANLYEQGINGILADEMGLGKTVQSISVMAYLAEVHNIWGPFLVVAPASTLHNWQQEVSKFVPEFKVLPYWGSNKDRKVLRKFWDRQQLRYTKDSPFHVLVTSYQLVVADAQYLNRIKWQYMILDEAQAIKSSSSTRWKSLLSMQCRNRLLLTGTPIQNSMQELWALLHFIMPTLFDSHEEFSDWFSKDIESHATKNKELNEAQLKRLHMILKPFMLRRVKKHVQQELGDKIEVDVYCNLSPRQKVLYKLVKSQISIRDLIERGASGEESASLMNLVMQFRKVCNHPDLFERQDVYSAFSFANFGDTNDFLREGNELNLAYTARNLVELNIPKLVAHGGGILDAPGPDTNAGPRRKLLEKFVVPMDSQNQYTRNISKFSGSTVSQIVRDVQKGIFERAMEAADDKYSHRSLILNNSNQLKSQEKDSELAILANFGVSNDYLLNNYILELDPAFYAPVSAPPIPMFTSSRSFFVNQNQSIETPHSLFPLSLDEEWRRQQLREKHQVDLPITPGFLPDNGKAGYTTISVPSMAKFIADSGKLQKLDELLVKLKRDDHRVLIYFQMTRMMDLMEDYLTYRQYKYLRLDGSSKLGDRRDLVNDWQTRPELFVFLLSTRAGGLGINLTAADTVVFFDSDWNPTIDSQAMDRAHRLGQTRQVTVYRLLVRGTIEERMRNRAKQKEQVQAVVMEGSKAAKELANKSKSGNEIKDDVAFWLLDDDA